MSPGVGEWLERVGRDQFSVERKEEQAASEKWRNKANLSLALLTRRQAVKVDMFTLVYGKQSQFVVVLKGT